MKLNAISSRQPKQHNNHKNINSNNTNFKGISDTLVKTWQVIDSSRGIQFTVEDMLGTNIPRTYSGAMSGYEYTGKVNWPYLLQEGIREFLTGPTMTLTPIGILAAATKLSGKTANTHKNNIINLSYLANQLDKENINEETFRTSFIKKTVEDMIEKTTGKDATPEHVEELSQGIAKYSSMIRNAENKTQKKEAGKVLSNLSQTFEKIIKSRKDSFKDTSFQTAIHSTVEGATESTNFENYVKYISAYADDYVKANKTRDNLIDLATSTIDKFKTNWCAKRVFTVASMIFGTGILMSFIPKIYTLASGGINPGGAAIYDEAAKREGK